MIATSHAKVRKATERKKFYMLKKVLMFGSICLLASATFSHASTIFSLTSDACTGTCGPAGTVFGTVTLTQTSAGVAVVEDLKSGEHFAVTGAGSPLVFNLDGSFTIDGLAKGFSSAGGDKASAFGQFKDSIECGKPLCSNGGKTSNSAGPLSFLVEGALISDFVANSDGYYFASDILGINGKTGNVGANDPGVVDNPPAVPEPSSLILFGTGLIGMAGAVRRRLSTAVTRS
jgi:hypothetical protein